MGMDDGRLSRRDVLHLLTAGSGLLLVPGCGAANEAAREGGAPDVGPPFEGDAGADASRTREDGGPDACIPTTGDVEGPYYLEGAPERAKIASDTEPGERLIISGTVVGPDCQTPLEGAVVDVWQADAAGNYHGADEEYRLRGVMRTNSLGEYAFETIMPGRYATGGGFRPAHIHFTVSHTDHVSLTTQLYFADDPFLPPNDACGPGCNSDEPDRVIPLSGGAIKRGSFRIVLAHG